MQWDDEAIILSVRPHGETVAIAEVFARTQGRYLGLVHGGRSRRMRPVLQPGNHVDATWKARLSEHLGSLSFELRRSYAAVAMQDAGALAAVQSMAALLGLLPERATHPQLFETSVVVLSFLDESAIWPALLVRWEVAFLEEMGFGLDLATCVATGNIGELVYVSPRSGRAVSRTAGQPYADKLLKLPAFLLPQSQSDEGAQTSDRSTVSAQDVLAGFILTGHFLRTRLLNPNGLEIPAARDRLVDRLTNETPVEVPPS